MVGVAEVPVDLQRWVRAIWGLLPSLEATPRSETILPDGCCELVVQTGDAPRAGSAGRCLAVQPLGILHGQLGCALELELPRYTGMVAVRFAPDGLHGLLGIAPAVLGTGAVALDDVFGARGRYLVAGVREAHTFERQVEHVVRFLRGVRNDRRQPDWLAVAVAHLARGWRVERVAARCGVTHGTLDRRFLEAVGLRPKQYGSLLRTRRAANALRTGRRSLSEIALDSGYADQSHMTREFARIVGCTPLQYRIADPGRAS
ncbi:MAG TPA: AraC family transcriptional regulator, partial [Xanthomonadales bacterium]|nr:AraC family transcriptional regulator [Xanthomonadales bacterium]